jgi:hypothetical protein
MSTIQNNETTSSRLPATTTQVPDGTSELPAAMLDYDPPSDPEKPPALPG